MFSMTCLTTQVNFVVIDVCQNTIFLVIMSYLYKPKMGLKRVYFSLLLQKLNPMARVASWVHKTLNFLLDGSYYFKAISTQDQLIHVSKNVF